jgi:hypothetical protein
MKRSRLRKVNPDTARENAALAPVRRAFVEENPICMVCGGASQCVHEISSGGGRFLGKKEPATWLSTCSHCNCEKMTDKGKYPVKRQLAIKMVMDPKNFDLEKFNRCYALGSVHLDDVAQFLRWV